MVISLVTTESLNSLTLKWLKGAYSLYRSEIHSQLN